MKFKVNDIIENRNGIRARIIQIDSSTQEYQYRYLSTGVQRLSPQFQGLHVHKISDIEHHWTLSKNQYPPMQIGIDYSGNLNQAQVDALFAELKAQKQQDSCIHEFQEYVGFRETYKFCIKCDKKI